jgi:hypothetical protein
MFEPLSPDELEGLIGGPKPAITSAPVELPKPEAPAAPPPEVPVLRFRFAPRQREQDTTAAGRREPKP